jgi:hypothetical protein
LTRSVGRPGRAGAAAGAGLRLNGLALHRPLATPACSFRRRCATCSCAWRSRQLYRARWTERIHDEWTGNVLRQRPDLKAKDLQRTRTLRDLHVRRPAPS